MLFLVFDLKVVEKGFEIVLGRKAGVKQETFDARPLSETSIVEHLQVVGKLYRSIGKKNP